MSSRYPAMTGQPVNDTAVLVLVCAKFPMKHGKRLTTCPQQFCIALTAIVKMQHAIVSLHDASLSLHCATASLHYAVLSLFGAGVSLHDAALSLHGAGVSLLDAIVWTCMSRHKAIAAARQQQV